MEKKEIIKEKEKESSALERLNKITTGICAFLAVLVLNDIRTSVSDLKDEVKSYVSLYNNLEKRVSILEYSKTVPNSYNSAFPKDSTYVSYHSSVFTKPEEISIKKKKV